MARRPTLRELIEENRKLIEKWAAVSGPMRKRVFELIVKVDDLEARVSKLEEPKELGG